MTEERTVHGLRDTPLGSYLGAVGLLAVLGQQADPAATLRWEGSNPVLRTAIADLPDWLAAEYRPSVILSPWNKSTGYGPDDKKPRETLSRLLALPSSRIGQWQAAHAVAAPLAARFHAEGWKKDRLVRELRNRVPEEFLGWIDSSVVLTRVDLQFPPLLGTGGNDGHFDFSWNFHQRLLDVLPVNRADLSTRWATDLLDGTSGPLVSGVVGQFHPIAAGGQNSSTQGAANSLTNPWGFVLMVEGMRALTSGVVQRLHGLNRAAIPFTVDSSPDGGGAGTAGEKSRGEFWAPRWSAALSYPEMAQLFREGRAAWNGRTAARAVHMYEAARSFGVARGVDGFTRYGIHKLNGDAHVAVTLDRVEVHEDPLVHALLPVERWIESSRRAQDLPTTAPQWQRADRAHLLYAKSGGTDRLVDVLAHSTRLRIAVGQSARLRAEVPPPWSLPRATLLSAPISRLMTSCPEARLARALVAAQRPGSGPAQSVISLAVPAKAAEKGWRDAVVQGLGSRPLVDVLADLAIWCARRGPSDGKPNDNSAVLGVQLVTGTVRAPWPDLHAWVNWQLDDVAVERHLLAFLALDWRQAEVPTLRSSLPEVPHPLLALLTPFSVGLRRADTTAPVLGLDPTWTLRLRAGQLRQVGAEAVARLAREGWRASQPFTDDSRAGGAVGQRPAGAYPGRVRVAHGDHAPTKAGRTPDIHRTT